MTLTVSFRNFWQGFNPYDFYIPLITSSTGCKVVIVPAKSQCDLEVVSVFDSRPIAMRAVSRLKSRIRVGRNLLENNYFKYSTPSPLAKVSIWYTGENIRPPIGRFDRTWSFEPNSKISGNLNFPIWWLQFPELVDAESNSLGGENRLGTRMLVNNASRSRSLEVAHREKFCCAFLSYNEPGRHAVLKALETIGPVDIFGQLSGHTVGKKLDVALEYKFMFCGENDSYPGYITEKIFDAWGAGCVPIWLGIDQGRYLNPEAYISPWDFEGFDDFVDHVKSINYSDAKRSALINSALLARIPDLSELKQDLKKLLVQKTAGSDK